MLGIFLLNAAADEVVEQENKQEGEGPASTVEDTVNDVLHKAVEEIKAEIGGLEASEGLQNLEHQAADLGERFVKSAHDVEEATEEVLHEATGGLEASEFLQNLEHQAADLGERFMKSAHDVEEATEEVLHEAIGWAKKLSQDLNNLVTGSEHHQEQEEQQQEPTHDAKEEL